MNNPELATIILGYKNFVPNLPTVREQLGESYGTALQLGWLVPDYENGMIAVTNDQGKLSAMESAAKETKQVVTAEITNESYRNFSPFNPQATIIVEDDAVIGDKVTVVDGGKQFEGIVQTVGNGGEYTVSFAGPQPSRTNFKTEDLRVTQRAEKPSSPAASHPQQTQQAPSAAPAVRLPVPGVG